MTVWNKLECPGPGPRSVWQNPLVWCPGPSWPLYVLLRRRSVYGAFSLQPASISLPSTSSSYSIISVSVSHWQPSCNLLCGVWFFECDGFIVCVLKRLHGNHLDTQTHFGSFLGMGMGDMQSLVHCSNNQSKQIERSTQPQEHVKWRLQWRN